MEGVDRLDTEALKQINSGAMSEKGVIGLADSLGITPRHLRRLVKAKTGSTPGKIDRERRLREAKALLQKTKLSVVAVAFSCDFASLRQFNDAFRAAYKMTPREMRKNYWAMNG